MSESTHEMNAFKIFLLKIKTDILAKAA